MSSHSEYFRNRMIAHDRVIRQIEQPLQSFIGKKRTYSEAMGKDNDYEVVQEPLLHINNRGDNWIDSYLEQNK